MPAQNVGSFTFSRSATVLNNDHPRPARAGRRMASLDPQRPNVLLIISDDQGAWALGCAGNGEIRTPVLGPARRERHTVRELLLHLSGLLAGPRLAARPAIFPRGTACTTGSGPAAWGTGRIDYLAGQRMMTDAVADERLSLRADRQMASRRERRAASGTSSNGLPTSRAWDPYYGAPMVDEDRARAEIEGYITEELGTRAMRFIAERGGAAGAVLAEPQFHRAALSRGSTSPSRSSSPISMKTAPSIPALTSRRIPNFAGGNAALAKRPQRSGAKA